MTSSIHHMPVRFVFLSMFAVCVINMTGGECTRAAVNVNLLAITGEQAPDLPAGANFTQFDTPVINSTGQTAFFAAVTGGGVSSTSDSGFFTGTSGNLGIAVREGDAATEAGAGINFGSLERNSININSRGDIGFRALLTGTNVDPQTDNSTWVQMPAGNTLMAREGELVLGVGNIDEFFGKYTALNDVGMVGFRALFSGSGVTAANDDAFLLTGGGSISPRAVEGGTAAFTGTSFRSLGNNFASNAVINNQNRLAYDATLDPFPDQAVFSGRDQAPTRFGDTAPGADANATFNAFGDPNINSQGNIVFDAGISGHAAGNEGVFVENDLGVTSIAIEGDSAPGMGAGVVYGGAPNVFFDAVINGRDDVAFQASVTGGGFNGDRGIWAQLDGALTNLAQTGDATPGIAGGTFFSLGNPSINGLGQVVFQAQASTNAGDVQGIWAWHNDQLELVVAQGSQIETSPGVLRTVDRLLFAGEDGLTGEPAVLEHPGPTGNEDGRPSAISDEGHVTFFASFGSDAGIFVASLVPSIPGDYNVDGVVDAADYVVWRNNLGAPAGTLPNDTDGGTIGSTQYDTWRANFGSTSGAIVAGTSLSAVPEPSATLLFVLGASLCVRPMRIKST